MESEVHTDELPTATYTLAVVAESVCSACRGQSKLAFERAPYRVKEGLWAHKPSPGYCHKPAVCPASAIWEKKNG